MREGLDLLKRADIEPATVGPISPQALPRIISAPDWLFNNVFLKKWKVDAKARSSMADDLAAGRKTEIDFLNGELVRLADRLQRAAPVNRAIVELVHKAEAGAEPLSPAALRKAALA
jgi:2-dehydropantoate 2-reductase